MTYWPHSDPHDAGSITATKGRKRFGCKVKVQQGAEWVLCDSQVDRGVYVCLTCARNLAEDLALVDELLRDLAASFSRQTRTGDKQAGSRSANTAVPFDTRAGRVNRRLLGDLIRWAGYINDAIGTLHGPTCLDCSHPTCRWSRQPRPPAPTGAAIATWLTAQIPWLQRYRGGASFATTIAHRVVDAQAATDLPEGWRKILGPCLECELGELEAFLSDCDKPSIIRCTNDDCVAEYTTSQWMRLSTRFKQRAKASA